MDPMEFNKIFSAVLVAGITAMLAGFFANKIVHPHKPEKMGYYVEVPEGGINLEKPQKPEGPEPILAMLTQIDAERGQRVARACATCHSFEKGGPHKIGPNLWNTVGNTVGLADDFAYSDIFNEWSEQDKVWDYQALNHFLWKPKRYAEGTKMNFVGLKKPEDRAAVIAWLRTLSDNPPAMPTAEELAAEQAEAETEDAETDAETEKEAENVSMDTDGPGEGQDKDESANK